MTGAGAKTFGRFLRSVSGSIRFTGVLSYSTGLAKAAYGAIRFTATLTRKVMFKRSVVGSMTMAGNSSRTQAYRVRLIAGTIHFTGLARNAAVYVLKGLSRFGFSTRER